MGLLSFTSITSFALSNAEHLVWDKTPLHIELPIEKEKTIVFPAKIEILHNELMANELAVLVKASNTLYVKSFHEFDEKAVFVQMLDSGEKVKINFSSHATSHNTRPVEIEVNNHSASSARKQDVSRINPISITRFAIQTLFAPERVVEEIDGVGRVAMQTQRTVNMVYGGAVIAHPLISFGGNGLVVTAVELKNNLSRKIKLDPRMVIGKWESATFYPSNTLSEHGSQNDKTTLFVTSYKPFGQALAELREDVR